MPRPPVHIDPDITVADTLPGHVYRDPATYETQRSRIFARSWQLIGHTDQVKVPGQVHPLTILKGCLDEPVVLTRDFDDRIHLLSNVCTHRSMIVCEGPGNERHLRCRYHGRRFGLDGCFQHMPEFEQTKNFPSELDNLVQIPLQQWRSFLFAALQPETPPFDEVMQPMLDRMSWLPLDAFRFDASRSRDYLLSANWALYCDNYLEGFHIPYVHAGLSESLDYGAYRSETFDWCNVQIGIGQDGESTFDLPHSSHDHGQLIAGYFWWVWPNLMFNFYPWGLSINIVKPLAVDRTRVSFLAYVWDESKLNLGAGAELDRVEREDEAIVEAVQRGVRSRFYSSGRYSPAREQCVHHFHMLMARALNADRSPPRR